MLGVKLFRRTNGSGIQTRVAFKGNYPDCITWMVMQKVNPRSNLIGWKLEEQPLEKRISDVVVPERIAPRWMRQELDDNAEALDD